MAGFASSPLRPAQVLSGSNMPGGPTVSAPQGGFYSPLYPSNTYTPAKRPGTGDGVNWGTPMRYNPQQPAAQQGPAQGPAAASAPINRMSTTTTTGPRQGYEDVTMSDYRSALGAMPASMPRESQPRVAAMSMNDRTAGENAAYGRARDQVGQESRGALDSLSDEMSARGLSGAGLEGALTGGILQRAQGQLGDVNREQAIDRMRRADQIQSENYQGNISQRGADLGANVQQRGQDIGAREANSTNAMRLTELLRRTKNGTQTSTTTTKTSQRGY